jgi:hypothetical protein
MENQAHHMMVLNMDPVILFATAGFLLEFGEDDTTKVEFSRQSMRQVCIVNDIAEEDALDLTQLGKRTIDFTIPSVYVLELAVEFAHAVDKAKDQFEGDNIQHALRVLVRHWITPMTDALAIEEGRNGPDRTHTSMN